MITINEGDTWRGRRLYDALLGVLHERGLAGATVSRAIAGYAGRGAIKSAELGDIVDIGEPMPLRIEVADRAELIERVLPDVYEMVEQGLVELQDTKVVRWWPSAEEPAPAASREDLMRVTGRAKEVHIQIGEDDESEGEPLYEAIVKRAHQLGIAGVSVYRGIEGYGAHGMLHRHKALSRKRADPILLTIVDSAEHVEKLVAAMDAMVTRECMLTIQDVTVVKYAPRGEEHSGVPLEPALESSAGKP